MQIEKILTSRQHLHHEKVAGFEFGAVKVVFLDHSGQLGGAELMLLDLIPELGLDSRVILLESGQFEQSLLARGIPTQVISSGGMTNGVVGKRTGILGLARAIPGVWRTTRQVALVTCGVDLLYANTARAWIIGALVAWRENLRLICHLHDVLSAGHFSAVNCRLLVWAANCMASAVIANSQASADAFIEAGGRAKLVTVIPNGFDLSHFDMKPMKPQASLRVELNIDDAPLIIMPGRLAFWKGQHIFIHALSKLPGIHGLVVGEALFTEEDRRYASGLHELSQSLGCANRIHFCGFRTDMPAVLKQADVVVHCSVEPEPFGRVIVEAMLCARPVIVSAQGGAMEIVEDGLTGLYHTPGDATSLAACIQRILETPESARAMGLMASKLARERYALSGIAQQTVQMIKDVSAS